MKITIFESTVNTPENEEIVISLQGQGYEVATATPTDTTIEQFAKVDTSDAVLIVNDEVHPIGTKALMGAFHGYSQGLEVFTLNQLSNVEVDADLGELKPIALDGDINRINSYVESLPLVYMSTTSHPKQQAVSRAMRKFGIPVRIEGAKFPSGVSEQPMTMEETYKGAINRHQALLQASLKADYYCTIESGFDEIHANHNPFGCSVIVFQEAGKKAEVGVEVDIEFPKDVFDEVPLKYADVGVLIQQKYKSVHKDAYPFLTNGKLTRQVVLENALYNLLVRNKELV